MSFYKRFEDAKQLREKARFVLSFYKDNPEVSKMLEFMTLDEFLFSTLQKHVDQHAPAPSNNDKVQSSTNKVTWNGVSYTSFDTLL